MAENCPGLGTSSILAGAVMAVLWSASGKAFDIDSLNHAVCTPAGCYFSIMLCVHQLDVTSLL